MIGTVRGAGRTRLHDVADSADGRLVVESLDITEPDQLTALRVIETLRSLVTPDGTIGVMSSRQGSLAMNTNGGQDAYRAGAVLTIDESIPGVVATISAQSGKPGLQFLDHHGETVPW